VTPKAKFWSHSKHSRPTDAATPTLQDNLKKVVADLVASKDPAVWKAKVKDFLTTNNVRIVVTFGGDVGAGFGIAGAGASWGFSARPI